MFTGIIEESGTVEGVKDQRGGKEFIISASFARELRVDQSISINGACHTVVGKDRDTFGIQSVEETLRKTNLGDLREGDPVNLERSMTMERLLDGHIVQGHVDETGIIVSIEEEGMDHLVTLEYSKEHRNLVVGRGSIAVDGISLTVAQESGNRFVVAIIPYTWEHTNFYARSEGDKVNLEFDILGKYVARHLESRGM